MQFQSSAESDRIVGNQLMVVGDCLDVLGRLAPSSIDVCVTSPPYNIGIVYHSHDDRMPRDAYLCWMTEVGRAIARVLKSDGAFFLNVGSTNVDPWIAHDVARAFANSFTLQNQIVWAKSLTIDSDSVGHFKPINSRRFLNNNHEFIYHFTKTGSAPIDRLSIGVPFKDKSNIARWGHAQDRRCAGNIWFMPYKTVRSKAQKYDHPSGFPVELPMRCIRMHGKNPAVVLDPFMGSGTTLVAAERLGLSGIGIELDPTYAAAAQTRLQTQIG